MSEPSGGLPRPSTHPAEFDAGFSDHSGYADALTHLYGRLNTEALDPATFARVDRNLDAFRAFLARLGNPHLGRPTVHLTGTRGKGSTLSMLEAILVQAGRRTGATVSPHLMEVRERIRIAGEDLSRDDFARLYAIVREPAETMMNGINFRTVFELLTALAFVAFDNLKVDAALVEVGMGGRLDATNVVEPSLSIITRIGLDHTHILGDTVEAIADDKAQIIKPGGPAIVSRQPAGALDVLQQRCREVAVDCWRLDHEIVLSDVHLTPDGTEFTLTTPHRRHELVSTPLLGQHQAENAAVAVAAADRLDADGIANVDREMIRTGLLHTRWPGRGEILHHSPTVMIDGAHTDQGATALNDLLDTLFPTQRRILILGMNRDKDPNRFLDCFHRAPDLVLATRADSPRSLDADEMARIVQDRGWTVRPVALSEAFEEALAVAEPGDVIVGTGSFYVIGALRRIWLRRATASSTFQA